MRTLIAFYHLCLKMLTMKQSQVSHISNYRIAKSGYCMILILFSLVSLSAMAQNADSIVLIHKNRTTIIPVPVKSKKTAIEITDSNRVIEIGVSSRELSDNHTSVPEFIPGKSTKTIKWFSRFETGYTMIFSQQHDPGYYYNPYDSITYWVYYNNDIIQGLKVGLSVYEKEKIINQKFSFALGFDLGYSVLTRNGKNPPEASYDSVVNVMDGGDPLRVGRFQLICPLEFRYRITQTKSVSFFRVGLNLGTTFNLYRFSSDLKSIYTYNQFSGNTPFLIQPKLGWESGKIGFTAAIEFRITYSNYTYGGFSYPVTFALTYRFY